MFAPRIARQKAAASQATRRSPPQHAPGVTAEHHEQEAESVADAVLDPTRTVPNVLSSSAPARAGVAPGTQAAVQLTESAGGTIDPGAARFLQARFGHSFSQVRIHDDSAAHGVARAIGARAFTLGDHVAFGEGQYAPGTRAGMTLLAHELTHVLQDAANPLPVLRRAPDLSKRTTGEKITDKIAADVDAALAASKTITTYVAADQLKKTSGHLHTDLKGEFEKHEADSEKASGQKSAPLPQGQVTAGFTDLRTGVIHLKDQVATVESAVHEAVHLNSKVGNAKKGLSAFQLAFGNPIEEGVTQYFTNKVLAEQKLNPGTAYPDQLQLAQALITALGSNGEKLMGDAYFKGTTDARDALVNASNKHGDFRSWLTLSQSDDPKNWPAAIKELKRIFP
jgi:Domain of unknown function (DUF4157)